MRSYQHLKQKKDLIKKLFIEELKLTENEHYKLKRCITCSGYNHFTIFINKLTIKDINNELELNKNYYYDDTEFNDNFQRRNNNDIYQILNFEIFLYLRFIKKLCKFNLCLR